MNSLRCKNAPKPHFVELSNGITNGKIFLMCYVFIFSLSLANIYQHKTIQLKGMWQLMLGVNLECY